MESVAMGIPAVTTDLSGFGAYVQRHIEDARNQGIMVLNRRPAGSRTLSKTGRYLLSFSTLNRRQRIELRNRVERLGEQFDWSVLSAIITRRTTGPGAHRRHAAGTFELRVV